MPNSENNRSPEKNQPKRQGQSECGTPSQHTKDEKDGEDVKDSKPTIPQSSLGQEIEPQFIGKYQILRSIGRGGMGVVYLGLNPDTEGQVAIKTLPDNLSQANLIARFKREAKLAAKVNHPNTVRVLDAGYDKKTAKHYIVTEYVDGQDLEQIRAARGGQLPWLEAVGIIKSVSRGLKEAAKHGIVHRDIKPANIMVAKNALVKLTDLGVAKQMDVESKLTVVHQIVGTPAYLSPEQIQSPTEVDTRSDIYSLGATFYHLLAGNYPHTGASHYDTMRKIVSEPTPDICQKVPDIPNELGNIISKMMEKKAENRYQTLDELLEALYRIQPEGGTPSVMTTLVDGESGFPLEQLNPKQISSPKSKPLSGRRNRMVLLFGILVFCIAGTVFYRMTTDLAEPSVKNFGKSNDIDLNAGNQDRHETKTALKKKLSKNKKQRRSFQVLSEDNRSTSLKKDESIKTDSKNTFSFSQDEKDLSQKKDKITRQYRLLQDVLRVKSIMLDSKSSAATVEAEKLAGPTYQLGILAEQRGDAAFEEIEYVEAEKAYSEADASFRLSSKKAQSQAEKKANKEKDAEELRKISKNVTNEKQKMLEAKKHAKRNGAETAAEKIYQLALQKQGEADKNLEKGTSDSLQLAQNSYSQAASLYKRTFEHIKKISQLKEKADFQRTEMLAIKAKIQGQDNTESTKEKYKRAKLMELAGGHEYESENYSSAEKSFLQGKNLYTEVAKEIILILMKNAEETKSSLLEVKDLIDSDYYNEPSYQEALVAEDQANGAFREKNYEKATQDYKRARNLFGAVQRLSEKNIAMEESMIKAKFSENNTTKIEINKLVAIYKQQLQKRDVGGLSALLNFSNREERSWREFFRLTVDLNCSVKSRNLEIHGKKATIDLDIQLAYLNKHSNKWEDRNVPMTWKLEKIEGIWMIISR